MVEQAEPKKEPDGEPLDRSKFTVEVPIKIPDMGEGLGRLLKWYKNEGDIVRRDDVICDIETPDFVYGMEIEDESIGIMGKHLFEAPSEPLEDGTVICIIMHGEKAKKDEEVSTEDEAGK
jgi:pyruvate/2-oxoglutarate dehydrogenase complex dihydrolipoamide acyltransferase (E2) component